MSGQVAIAGVTAILQSFFSKVQSPPTNFYVAVLPDTATAPTPFISGSELDELAIGGYARVAIPNDSAHWVSSGLAQVISNAVQVNFPTATANWGRIRYWAICDAATGGNILLVGQFTSLVTVNSGDTLHIPIGEIAITLGDFYAADTNG